MAASAPPNLLSDDKEKLLSCISEKTVPCVFNIEVNELIAKDKGKRNSKGGPSKGFSSSITGFAIAQRGNVITILTCAHGFDEAYSEEKGVTVDSLKNKFEFMVRCTHRNESERESATVKAVDCRKDLLLLELVSACTFSHRPLSMGHPPKSQDLVVLQSWPLFGSKTMAYGRVTCFGRTYDDLTSDNHKGYNMVLTELTDLCCANGCSGGPLIDGKLCYVGVYHGTQRNSGYAVSFNDMKLFVDTHFNMVNQLYPFIFLVSVYFLIFMFAKLIVIIREQSDNNRTIILCTDILFLFSSI